MQLTRAVLTVALAASTASALPAYSAAELDPSRETETYRLEDTQRSVNTGSPHGSPHDRSETGLSGNQADKSSFSSRNPQSKGVGGAISQGTPSMNNPNHEQSAGNTRSGAGKASEKALHIMKTPESQLTAQGSVRSSSSKQTNMDRQQQGSMGNGASRQTNAGGMETTHNQADSKSRPKTQTGVNRMKSSTTRTGFTLNVRDLFSMLRQGQSKERAQTNQLAQDMSPEEMNRQQQGSEHSVGVRQDRVQGEMAPSEMDRNGNEIYVDVQQNREGRDNREQSSNMPNFSPSAQEQESMMQSGNNVQNKEIMEGNNREQQNTRPNIKEQTSQIRRRAEQGVQKMQETQPLQRMEQQREMYTEQEREMFAEQQREQQREQDMSRNNNGNVNSMNNNPHRIRSHNQHHSAESQQYQGQQQQQQQQQQAQQEQHQQQQRSQPEPEMNETNANMQPSARSEMVECLRAAMGDLHAQSMCVNY